MSSVNINHRDTSIAKSWLLARFLEFGNVASQLARCPFAITYPAQVAEATLDEWRGLCAIVKF